MVNNNRLYKDIFDNEFLNYFGDYKEAIGNISFENNELSVDLNKIANIIDVKINNIDSIHHSGQYDSEEKVIYVNGAEPIQHQRFTIAHELGHCILGHKGVSNRLTDGSEYSFSDSIKERAANRFATLLLMPQELLAIAIDQYQQEKGLTDEELECSSANALVESLAKMLKVSKQSMQYRLINLGVIEG